MITDCLLREIEKTGGMGLLATRIKQELTQIEKDEDGICRSLGGKLQIFQNHDDAFSFAAVMAGPAKSPYREGIFNVSVKVPKTYPMMPPTLEFTTPIWHPNIDFETGQIELEILGRNWNPTVTLQSLLLMVFALLQDPIVDGDVANQKAADQFKQATNEYLAFSEYLTQYHAGTKAKVTRVKPMGLDDAIAQATLKRHDCDVAGLRFKRYGLDVAELSSTFADKEQRLSTNEALVEPQNEGVMKAVGVCNGRINPLHEILDASLPAPSVIQLLVGRVEAMGFDSIIVQAHLERHGGDENAAVAELLAVSGLGDDANVNEDTRLAMQEGFPDNAVPAVEKVSNSSRSLEPDPVADLGDDANVNEDTRVATQGETPNSTVPEVEEEEASDSSWSLVPDPLQQALLDDQKSDSSGEIV